jgi:CRP/FNR family cyclic AMP-dependent transcriptional regulator
MLHGTLNYQLIANAGAGTENFGAGEVIFEEGSEGDRMYVVRSGEVAIEKDGKILATLGAGDILGEMALIDGSKRCATARASQDCEVAPITEKTFLFLVHETPSFALSVMRTLADRLRRLNQFT